MGSVSSGMKRYAAVGRGLGWWCRGWSEGEDERCGGELDEKGGGRVTDPVLAIDDVWGVFFVVVGVAIGIG